MITAALLQVCRANAANATLYAPFLDKACTRYNINTPRRIAGFLANLAVESAYFSAVVEDCYYRDPARLYAIFPRDFESVADAEAVQAGGAEAIANRIYANQNGNGAESSGDGWRYRGRGLGQTTGRRNYAIVGMLLGLDLVGHPELLEIPKNSANAAGVWWDTNSLNIYADESHFQAVCGVWNVGSAKAPASRINGFRERVSVNARLIEYFHKNG